MTFADVRHACWQPDADRMDILVNTGTASGVPVKGDAFSGLRWIREITDVELVSGLAEMILLSSLDRPYSEIREDDGDHRDGDP